VTLKSPYGDKKVTPPILDFRLRREPSSRAPFGSKLFESEPQSRRQAEGLSQTIADFGLRALLFAILDCSGIKRE
jgi:hypothetical protein